MENIKNFFYPKSICVVGASTKEKSIGYELLHTISNYGYKGIIYPVNPKAESVLGYKCYKSIEDIDGQIDLGIVVVPKQFAEDSVDSLLAKNVKSIVLITAGFKEVGKEGEEVEKRITKKVKDAGARLVGPNCMGVINTLDSTKLNATFVAEKPEIGGTGFLSQSGALGAAVLNSLRETDIKFAHFISVGNKADINENDLLHYWQSDDNIKTITTYLESFVNGENFIKPLITGEVTKPVIVLKAGKTSSGMKAASSHTGALSSRDQVVEAVLRQFGILRVNDINELFNTAKGFENFPFPQGNRVAVITNAGGPAILAVDSLEKENLVLAEFSEETKEKLREVVNPEGSVMNPVDLLPGATAEVYRKVNEIVVQDANVDSVISIFVQPVMVDPFEVVEAVYDINTDKPILQVDMPLPEFWDDYRKFSKKKLPIFRTAEEPAEVISNMLYYSMAQEGLKDHREEYAEQFKMTGKGKFNFKPGFVSQEEIFSITSHYNIPIVKQTLIKPDEIKNLSGDIFPVVLKGINHEVIHKSELDAVKLNIKTRDELIEKADEIISNFNRFKFDVEQFLIQQFIEIKHEVLLGGFRDPSFGPIIMFGTGGKYVEVICDTAIRSAYMSDNDLNEIIEETVIGKILKGVRGEEGIDMNKLKRVIRSSSKMMIENENIVEFDLNPLIISKDNSIHAVDVRIKIK
ncbi:putative acetyl-coa synthetase (adp-forming) [hydrocarbon metagenome]|uniref:Putative acetyl-coa synthetase (Adp-forming) n=1 Tax=hydrocarbon metagenome TaxID=938273 RepID=A0A0W8FXI4_9ZZZZ